MGGGPIRFDARNGGRSASSGGSGYEVVARVGNFEICKAAFEKALFVYPNQHLELRQGARIILKSKEQPPGAS
jgi:hypothetical protein